MTSMPFFCGVPDDFFDLGGGITVILTQVNGFGTDTPFQIEKEGVEVMFCDKVNEFADEIHRFHLPSQIHLCRSDFKMPCHDKIPLFVYRIL